MREKEVLDLLLIPIRKHKYSRIGAWKAIDYLLSSGGDGDSEDLISKGGLKYIFPSLMGTVTICGENDDKNNGVGWKNQSESDKLEFENHLLSILKRLLQLPWVEMRG